MAGHTLKLGEERKGPPWRLQRKHGPAGTSTGSFWPPGLCENTSLLSKPPSLVLVPASRETTMTQQAAHHVGTEALGGGRMISLKQAELRFQVWVQNSGNSNFYT